MKQDESFAAIFRDGWRFARSSCRGETGREICNESEYEVSVTGEIGRHGQPKTFSFSVLWQCLTVEQTENKRTKTVVGLQGSVPSTRVTEICTKNFIIGSYRTACIHHVRY